MRLILPLLCVLMVGCDFEQLTLESKDCESKNFGFEVHWGEISAQMSSHTFVVGSLPSLESHPVLCAFIPYTYSLETAFYLLCDHIDESLVDIGPEVEAGIVDKWYRGIVTPAEDHSVCGCVTKKWTMTAEIESGHEFQFDTFKTVCSKEITDTVTITQIGGSNG